MVLYTKGSVYKESQGIADILIPHTLSFKCPSIDIWTAQLCDFWFDIMSAFGPATVPNLAFLAANT